MAGSAALAARMAGATITGIARRGKYLRLILSDEDALLVHLCTIARHTTRRHSGLLAAM
ncbi:DNA-formamidopyrimidine glycosylase family protein [Glutamicibacter sp. X7]